MKRYLALLVVLAPLAAVGCGRNSKTGASGELDGKVDALLAAELQEKQDAVRKMLVGLRTSTPIGGVSYKGRIEPVLDEVSRTARWDFSSPPNGDKVPVTLYVEESAGGGGAKIERKVDRVFLVSKSGSQFMVTRSGSGSQQVVTRR